MKFFLRLLLLLSVLPLSAQTGIYIPSAKPIKNMQRAMVNPEHFCLLIHYPGSAPDYPVDALDWLDSAYSVAFSRSNPMLYSITIEGYSNNQSLNTQRVDAVYNYFANRSYAPFPIRYAANPISCHCHGDTFELVRYEVPVDRRAFITNDLPPSRRTFNGSIDLDNCVLVSFRNNPDECLGAARGCIIPAHDTTIRAYYASVFIKQGALYSVRGTKDTCPPNPLFSIEEHLDYRPILEDYFLVPHRKQIILQVGYVVLHSSINRAYGECSQPLPDSIYVRFPVTQDQLASSARSTRPRAPNTRRSPPKKSLPRSPSTSRRPSMSPSSTPSSWANVSSPTKSTTTSTSARPTSNRVPSPTTVATTRPIASTVTATTRSRSRSVSSCASSTTNRTRSTTTTPTPPPPILATPTTSRSTSDPL